MSAFECRKTIRFAQCDPAGIVFYPRYAELFNEVVEDWFDTGLGVSFYRLHEEHKLGIPTVRLTIDYKKPSRYGETLVFSLAIARLGRSSIQLAVTARGDGEETIRIRGEITVVLVNGETWRPHTIDDAWRARFDSFIGTPWGA